MILTDRTIRAGNFIQPTLPMAYRDDVLSYGLSSMGYDARLGSSFLKYRDESGPLDPKRFNPEQWIASESSGPKVLDAWSFYLAHAVEVFTMPDDTLAWCVNKSSYARNALSVDVTPLEPGWAGQVTLELRTHAAPVVVYPGEGICQFVFFRAAERPAVTYRDKGGVYMGQTGVTPSRRRRAA